MIDIFFEIIKLDIYIHIYREKTRSIWLVAKLVFFYRFVKVQWLGLGGGGVGLEEWGMLSLKRNFLR